MTRPLPTPNNEIGGYVNVPAKYPPNSGDYFVPSSDLGNAMFNTGTVTSTTADTAEVGWTFTPVP